MCECDTTPLFDLSTLVDWINSTTKRNMSNTTFYEDIKTGVILCEHLNNLLESPILDINQSTITTCVFENIASFLRLLTYIGFSFNELFRSDELYSGQPSSMVISTLSKLYHYYKKCSSIFPYLTHLIPTTTHQKTQPELMSFSNPDDPQYFFETEQIFKSVSKWISDITQKDVTTESFISIFSDGSIFIKLLSSSIPNTTISSYGNEIPFQTHANLAIYYNTLLLSNFPRKYLFDPAALFDDTRWIEVLIHLCFVSRHLYSKYGTQFIDLHIDDKSPSKLIGFDSESVISDINQCFSWNSFSVAYQTITINNLTTDFDDGSVLVKFIEILTKHYHPLKFDNPTLIQHIIQNYMIAFGILKYHTTNYIVLNQRNNPKSQSPQSPLSQSPVKQIPAIGTFVTNSNVNSPRMNASPRVIPVRSNSLMSPRNTQLISPRKSSMINSPRQTRVSAFGSYTRPISNQSPRSSGLVGFSNTDQTFVDTNTLPKLSENTFFCEENTVIMYHSNDNYVSIPLNVATVDDTQPLTKIIWSDEVIPTFDMFLSESQLHRAYKQSEPLEMYELIKEFKNGKKEVARDIYETYLCGENPCVNVPKDVINRIKNIVWSDKEIPTDLFNAVEKNALIHIKETEYVEFCESFSKETTKIDIVELTISKCLATKTKNKICDCLKWLLEKESDYIHTLSYFLERCVRFVFLFIEKFT
ncbi:hypothetical protein QTN25_005302 [Entamoeba marina]